MGQAREGARHQVGVAGIARLVVPFGRGGAADRVGRAFAAALARAAAPLAIENVPGDGGLAGVARANVLAAAGREPVLLLGTPTTHVLIPERLGAAVGPSAAFEPVAGLGSAPNVLLASSRLGVASVAELVTRARAATLTYGSAGVGQTIHLCTAWFCALARIEMRHVAYDQGSAAAYADLAAGRVHVYFDNVLGAQEAIGAGTVVPLAVSDRKRNRLLPGVPTLAECGYPRHVLDVWFGIFAANLDAASRERAESLAVDVPFGLRLAALGLSGGVLTGSRLAAHVADSAPAWRAALAST